MNWMNVLEAAEYIGVKRSTLYTLVSRGEIPHWKNPTRFKQADLDAWLEKKRISEPETVVTQGRSYTPRYFVT